MRRLLLFIFLSIYILNIYAASSVPVYEGQWQWASTPSDWVSKLGKFSIVKYEWKAPGNNGNFKIGTNGDWKNVMIYGLKKSM